MGRGHSKLSNTFIYKLLTALQSNINILGGYKDFDSIPQIIASGKLDLAQRTEESSGRYERAIKKTFLIFDNEVHKELFVSAMSSKDLSLVVKHRILALQFFAIDTLFQILFKECFLKIVESGRVIITKHDVIAFLKDKIATNRLDIEWSEETVNTVSRKFLTILKKLGYLSGSSKKRIEDVYNGPDYLTFFHYWLFSIGETSNVLNSTYFPLLMLSKEKYLFLMKQDEIRDRLDWQYTGNKFTVEPKLSINEYVNEL